MKQEMNTNMVKSIKSLMTKPAIYIFDYESTSYINLEATGFHAFLINFEVSLT